jgi:hypothetical protein
MEAKTTLLGNQPMPRLLHKLPLADNFSGFLNKRGEDLKHTMADVHPNAVLLQAPFRLKEPAWTEGRDRTECRSFVAPSRQNRTLHGSVSRAISERCLIVWDHCNRPPLISDFAAR